MIGPSGAGKTSFVRAGVVAARPEGWAALVCTPGGYPFRALGQALGPELAGDTEALGKLVGLDDPDTAVEPFGHGGGVTARRCWWWTSSRKYPTAALAYARKSLEVADTAAGRRLAVAALWGAPPMRVRPLGAGAWRGDFTSDGRHLAVYKFSTEVAVLHEDASPDWVIKGFMQLAGPGVLAFGPSDDWIVATADGGLFRFVSLPAGREMRTLSVQSDGGFPLPAWGSSVQHGASVWDLEGPPGARPRSLQRPEEAFTK